MWYQNPQSCLYFLLILILLSSYFPVDVLIFQPPKFLIVLNLTSICRFNEGILVLLVVPCGSVDLLKIIKWIKAIQLCPVPCPPPPLNYDGDGSNFIMMEKDPTSSTPTLVSTSVQGTPSKHLSAGTPSAVCLLIQYLDCLIQSQLRA